MRLAISGRTWVCLESGKWYAQSDPDLTIERGRQGWYWFLDGRVIDWTCCTTMHAAAEAADRKMGDG